MSGVLFGVLEPDLSGMVLEYNNKLDVGFDYEQHHMSY
jgi:hypothetical protein